MSRSRQQHFVPKNEQQANVARIDAMRIALARAQNVLQMIYNAEPWATRDVERVLMHIEEVMR